MYIVYFESFKNHKPERWFYGKYDDRNFANEVAMYLRSSEYALENNIYYCVCEESEVKNLNINNFH